MNFRQLSMGGLLALLLLGDVQAQGLRDELKGILAKSLGTCENNQVG